MSTPAMVWQPLFKLPSQCKTWQSHDVPVFMPLCSVLPQPVHFTLMFPSQLKRREYEVGLLVYSVLNVFNHLFWNRIHEHTISLRFLGIILKVLRLEVYKPVSTHFCWGGGGNLLVEQQEGKLLKLLSQLCPRIRPLAEQCLKLELECFHCNNY